MSGRINETAWLRTTPIGGKYNWESNQVHWGVRYRAAVAIGATTDAPLPLDVPQLQSFEQTLDSSFNWVGGIFQIGTGLVPLYIVQP